MLADWFKLPKQSLLVLGKPKTPDEQQPSSAAISQARSAVNHGRCMMQQNLIAGDKAT